MATYKSGYQSIGRCNIKTNYEIVVDGDNNEEISKLISNEFYKFNSVLSNIIFWASQQNSIKEAREKFISVLGDCYKEIPNEYYRSEYAEPWYYFYTVKGPVKVGWRKRVINIDWSEFPNKNKASELFPNEDVTKGEYSIHAWGYEKFREYVKKIISSEK